MRMRKPQKNHQLISVSPFRFFINPASPAALARVNFWADRPRMSNTSPKLRCDPLHELALCVPLDLFELPAVSA